MKSYLVDTDEGMMRVEYTGSTDDGVVVEYYDNNYQITSQTYISFELSIFGGFYEGEDAYYLVFGQNNSDEDDSVEVVRVVKYSKDWERLGAASLYGANTTIPFRAGSLRMTECNGYLYIRTSHQMYTSTDGLNHQANLMIEVQESDMTITDSYYSVMNNSVGYVSHSFNQFILVDDDNNLVALDHGDAYPRAAIISKYAKQAGDSTFSGSTSYVNVFSFEGETGTNSTGASLGGFEYSSTSYLVAGNSVTQDDDWSSHTARNVFVTVTSRSDFSSDGTEINMITDYDTDGSISASTPQLVKLDTDQFLLLWTTTEYADSSVSASKQVMLHYVYLDGNGDMTSEIYTTEGQLSDCKPVVVDGAAVWYVTGDSSGTSSSTETTPVFYKIASDGTCTVYSDLETPEITGISATDSGIEVTWNAVAGAEGYYVHYNSSTVTVTDADTTSAVSSASSGSTYYIWVEAYAGSSKSLVLNKQKFIYTKPELTNTSTGIQVDWPEITDASEYQIYKETEDDSWSLVQTTADTSWIDQDVSSGSVCTYMIRTVLTDGTVYDSVENSVTFLSVPTLLGVTNTSSGIEVTWETVEGAASYRVYYKQSTASSYSSRSVTAGSDSTQSTTLSLTSGTEYDFYVAAYADGSLSGGSETMTIYYLKAPTVTLSNSSTGIQLSWSEISGAEEYKIYRKTEEDSYSLVDTTADIEWLDTDVTGGTAYTYQVYTCSGDYVSAGSTEKTLIYLSTPTLLSLANTSGGVEVTWETVEGAASYRVYYKQSTASSYSSRSVTAGSDSTQSLTLSLTGGTEYDFYVAAYADGTLSDGSETMTICYLKTPTVTLSKDSTGIQLSWEEVTGAEGYRIYRKTGEGSYSLMETTSETSWTDKEISDGMIYTYQVYAYSGDFVSSGSAEVSNTITDISSCTITLSADSFTYDGTEKKPDVTVRNNGLTLAEGTDYTVSFSNNVNAGTANVVITGEGDYVGTKEKTFTINKADQSVSATVSSSGITVGSTTSISISGAVGTVTYVSDNTDVAMVDSNGEVTGVSAGTATITIIAAGTDNYNAATASVTITVTESSSGSDGTGGSGDTGSGDSGSTGDTGSGD
ncbi:MAG: Ig-like domain-containing protein, partial [Clostridiales bacterium]|nr:Ig-like domain-containing protein [Clostridiales bacterium]